MRRRVIVAYVALLLALAVGAWIGSRSPYAAAQGDGIGETPVPGRHSEVRAAFEFYVWDPPGWRLAEYKDERPHAYYKVDAAPGCGEWVVAPGTEAGLVLEPGGTHCQGFVIQFGMLYWFDMPPIVVTPPAIDTPTVTPSSPPFEGATATHTPTVASGATPTPSPQGGTPTATPTPAPVGTPTIVYGNMCEPNPTPVYPHSITIYGQGGLTAPAFYWWCQANTQPDLVILVPVATFEAAYNDGPRKLLQDLGR